MSYQNNIRVPENRYFPAGQKNIFRRRFVPSDITNLPVPVKPSTNRYNYNHHRLVDEITTSPVSVKTSTNRSLEDPQQGASNDRPPVDKFKENMLESSIECEICPRADLRVGSARARKKERNVSLPIFQLNLKFSKKPSSRKKSKAKKAKKEKVEKVAKLLFTDSDGSVASNKSSASSSDSTEIPKSCNKTTKPDDFSCQAHNR